MRAIIYSRVSTDGQERDGTSLDTQEQDSIAYAQAHGWYVIETVRDTTSGFSLDRPGLERVRRQVKEGQVDVILAYAVDRLSRNQNHVGILVDEAYRYDVKLDFVTESFEETAVGRFVMNVRAFVAEMEREKISERTTRGKSARARSGRIPQATGRGLYGYRYVRETGKREVEEFQASVVRRIFQVYAETKSFSGVSNALNDSGVPAFAGGRWYPLTIRSVLLRDAYIGRTVYRRTKRVWSKNGKKHSHVIQRPVDEWIEIEDATPRIVDDLTWERVQAILSDPERLRRKPESRHYALASRVRCGICGSAMVGQTLTTKGRPYRYYRCRHVYDKNTGHSCSARYVSADALERAVRGEVITVLSSPDIILAEMKKLDAQEDADQSEVTRLQKELDTVEKREKKLVQLFLMDDLNQDGLREEAANAKRQREALKARLQTLRRPPIRTANESDSERLRLIGQGIAEWLDSGSSERWTSVLEALQVTVLATREAATISGILPYDLPEFVTIEQTSA